nr:DUF748 domain-containing protein [Methylomagnum ishizawai]
MLWSLGLLVPLGLYALAGFYLTPWLVRAQVLPRLSTRLNVGLSAQSVAFDPFALRLVLKGFALKDKEGRPLIGLGRLEADLAGLGSLGQRAATLELKLDALSVHLQRGADGRLNLLALVPPDEGKPSVGGGFPFLLTHFTLARGRIEYRDISGPAPFVISLGDIRLDLENLGSTTQNPAHFEFSATTSQRETLSIGGTLALAPFGTAGKLEARDLDLAVWVGGLAPALPWRLTSGKLGFQVEFSAAAGDKPAIDLKAGEVVGTNLAATATGAGGAVIKLGGLKLAGLRYAGAAQCLDLDSIQVENVDSTWAKFAHLDAGKLAFTLADRKLTLESARLATASTPQGIQLGQLTLGKLAYALPQQSLGLDVVALQSLDTPWASLGQFSAGGLTYAVAEQSLKLKSAALDEAIADQEAASDRWRAAGQDSERKAASNAAEGKPNPAAASETPVAAAKREIPLRVRIGSLKIADVEVSLKRRVVDIGTLTTDQGEIGLRRTATGELKVPGLPDAPSAPSSGDRAGASPPPDPWRVRVDQFRLTGYTLGFRDETPATPVRIRLDPAHLRMDGFSTEPGQEFQFLLNTGLGEQGKIEVDGQAQLFPLKSEMRFGVDKLWLRSVQPYWEKFVGFNLARGRLNLWGDLVVRQDKDIAVDYSGAFDIVDFTAVDRRENQDLLRWHSLKFDGVVVGTAQRRASIRSITADQSYSKVFIGPDGALNLTRDLIVPPAETPAQAALPPPRQAAAPTAPWSYVIGSVRVVDAHMDFSDLTLNPSFATQIRDLNGNIRGLSSQENAKAEWLLEGHINQSAPAKLYGQLQPAHFKDNTDVSLEFRGVNLTTLSPYSGKFAGYRIEKGKLDMDLRYKLKASKLEVSNRMVLDQLVLGERVESPTATSLPVDMAVALLKDSAGKIDIDLPISGDLSNPQFSLGNLYSTAVQQMLTKLVGSPFSLLGNLVGGGDEKLSTVRFRAGDAELSADEKGELDKVAAALKERPELKLNIKGSADPVQDRMALAEAALLKQLRSDRAAELRALGRRVAQTEGLDLSDEDYRRLFSRYYRQRQAPVPAVVAPPSGQEPSLEGATFNAAKRRVLEQWNVSELELRLLAQARAEVIRDYLVNQAGLPDKRIYLLDVRLNPPEEKEIKAWLSVSGA